MTNGNKLNPNRNQIELHFYALNKNEIKGLFMTIYEYN